MPTIANEPAFSVSVGIKDKGWFPDVREFQREEEVAIGRLQNQKGEMEQFFLYVYLSTCFFSPINFVHNLLCHGVRSIDVFFTCRRKTDEARGEELLLQQYPNLEFPTEVEEIDDNLLYLHCGVSKAQRASFSLLFLCLRLWKI